MPVSPQQILQLLERQARRPLSAREILTRLDPQGSRRELHRLLKDLVRDGALVRLRGGRYSMPRQVNLIVGRVIAHQDGYGFLQPEDGGGRDIFLPARTMRQVMDGDRVAVRLHRGGAGGRPEGRVVRVLERGRSSVVGCYRRTRNFGYLVPDDPRLTHDLLIPRGGAQGARSGQVAIARIDVYPTLTRNPEGSVIEVLGDPADPEVELRAIAHKYGLPYHFPAAVLEAAACLPDRVEKGDRVGREDLRDLPLVTIDGETARDFDDAVAAVRTPKGGFCLWVAVADVAHYVASGQAVDREAYARGTSVYFPGRCLPMLPEVLSNGICSLNPGVERLVLVAELHFDRGGGRSSCSFYPAVMQSRARLTYREVQTFFDGSEAAESTPEVADSLTVMGKLAAVLAERRRQRGSLDFDLPEAEVVLDLRGRPEDIVRSERTFAHRLIEEFMLAANEAVAAHLAETGAPLLYRVHEPPTPEKVAELQEMLHPFGYRLPTRGGSLRPIDLQTVLRQAEGKPEERLVNQLLLRSLKQARYAPENLGHFGLAAERYCHFTSPIRRYPDLTVHRALWRRWRQEGGATGGGSGDPEETGRHTSWRERQAMEAEREIAALKKCQFLKGRLGADFDGVVASVHPFGFFVELNRFPVEGLVPLSSLGDDFYDLEEESHRLAGRHSGRTFTVGQPVRVRVARVDAGHLKVDFRLLGA